MPSPWPQSPAAPAHGPRTRTRCASRSGSTRCPRVTRTRRSTEQARRRPVHRRRRLHRTVGGAVCQVARPGARRRAARGDPLRCRRQRAQRRLPPVLAHARDRQRPVALPRRARATRAARASRTSDALAADLERLGDRRRVRGRRRPDRRARAARARRPRGGGRACAPVRPRRRAARPRAGPGRGELADVPRRPVDQGPVPRSSTPASSPTACARRRCAPACACASTARSRALGKTAAGVSVTTDGGIVDARRVLLATSAYPPLLRAIGSYIAPVYDYVLVTEPLDAAHARRDRVGRPARASATSATSSTTTG